MQTVVLLWENPEDEHITIRSLEIECLVVNDLFTVHFWYEMQMAITKWLESQAQAGQLR